MSSATYQFPRHDLVPESIVFGKSEVMQALRSCLPKVASAHVPVLIEGENGTGKDIIARSIHGLSPWKNGPFVKVNCAAISPTQLESELFAYENEAFAAHDSRPGRAEMACRGTLFLDEVSELDMALQSKLLQCLRDGQVRGTGAQKDQQMEFRIVCATSRPLEREIETKAFRQDLFYRINVLNLRIPPLRERYVDIEELVRYFLECYSRKYDCRPRPLSKELLAAMQQYPWPGNVRELENLINRYVILGSEDVIRNELAARNEQDFFNHKLNLDGPLSLKKLIREATQGLERKVILQVLQANHWNRRRAARVLCISYRGLLYKIRDAGLCPRPQYRAGNPVKAEEHTAE